MDRQKVLELARVVYDTDFGLAAEERLLRFAALIEAEVCGGMSRDKVFELMLAAGCSKYCDPKHPELEGFIVNDSVLDRIVALIEREVRGELPKRFYPRGINGYKKTVEEAVAEVRGDAEPVAWMSPKKERLEFSRADTVYGSHTIPLYTHPTPAVVRQLVDALRMVMDDPNALDGRPRTYECVQEALAAAKEAGL